MPIRVVRVASKWNKDFSMLTVLYTRVVKVKNRIAKKWLKNADAVTAE